MIFVGLGANLPAAGYPDALATCKAALGRLAAFGIAVEAASPWYESAPVPVSEQPWFINGVVRVSTILEPRELLHALHAIEAEFGRTRGIANAARPLDLDLLDYAGQVTDPARWPMLPHPRLHERAFVLLPLRDICPDWRHPIGGRMLEEIITALPRGQEIRPLRAKV